MQPIFRFAPSPNGHLHLGHAHSALLNADFARRGGGQLLLRIEDIDQVRCRPEYEASIKEDLKWLGVRWERPVRRQSEHFSDYAQALAHLQARSLVFPCFCTRRAAFEPVGPGTRRDPDGTPLYAGRCRRIAPDEARDRIVAGERHAWRLDIEAAQRVASGSLNWIAFDRDGRESEHIVRPDLWGAAVLARRDIPTSYHLSVVVDDALQGVTHVVRGCDLALAPNLHVLLQRLLGVATPRYHHHSLILDGTGTKLSKSAGSPSLRDLRRDGCSAADLRNRLGFAE